MTGGQDHHDASSEARGAEHQPIRYPTHHVIAVVDNRDDMTATVASLTSRGFMESEVQVGTGVDAADDLHASTGRAGLAGLLVRLAERIGAADEEMETKRRYEQAMRDNKFVISVATPTDERKDQATRILREHGAHSVVYFGKHTIEYVTAPNRR